MRRLAQITSQVSTCLMPDLMSAILPQKTSGHVVYLPVVGNEGRHTIPAGVLVQFRSCKPSFRHVMALYPEPGRRYAPLVVYFPSLLEELGNKRRRFSTAQVVPGGALTQKLGKP